MALQNPACLICNYVQNKDGKPYCSLRQMFTENLPPIRCEADCPERKTWVDDLTNL